MARMIDGDKLVENLRLIATCWSISPYVSKEKHNGAVDMLREVEREVKEAPTLTQPNEWISVEDRLPDAEEEVRLCCVTSWGYRYQCQGFYVPPGTRRDDSDYSWDWVCCEEYDEESDDYLVNPGWYECIHNWYDYSACGIKDKVTHWMPLPAPPDCRPPEGEA